MPRVTLYVPDDLKTRMDDAGEAINWSAVAQRAFREAVLTQAMRKEPHDMTNVVERLRASKAKVEARDLEYGKDEGATWAREGAEYDELERIAKFRDAHDADANIEVLRQLIDPDGEADPDYWRIVFGEDIYRQVEQLGQEPTGAFCQGFVEGAYGVFNEVRHQL
jgi:hypothetical protein